MISIDARVIGALQWVYDQMLDRLETRIGTFRMAIALTPLAAEATARILRGAVPLGMLPDVLFLFGVGIFYSIRMMKSDNHLQRRNKLVVINTRSLHFRSRHVGLRLFYLFFFSFSLLFHHNVGGLGMLAIVYARCLTVRERKDHAKQPRLAYSPS